MAVVKPKNLEVNYEGAWKELENHLELIDAYVSHSTLLLYMKELEEKHKNMITLKKRTDNEMVDYCIKKSVEAQMENIHLKKKLKECRKGTKTEHWIQVRITDEKVKKPERKLFDVHLVTMTKEGFSFTFDWHCTDKKTAYLSNAFKTQEEISWHGLKMWIVELHISIPGTEGKDKMAFSGMGI